MNSSKISFKVMITGRKSMKTIGILPIRNRTKNVPYQNLFPSDGNRPLHYF